ncbi:polysaccharide deacetylase [Hyphomicrobium denitrificans 1NES1]|uniref:Chitooligosaccharide deacetylase n=1 Tax=Hyphomicrobium denitrificans 1NES1 TaxID=670307 RepID=N0B8D9_9HYPH|nr:polysaccharide deacetylase family protein [Hyphomicrobium denitrificans]AGK58492.1 polysaccharide deacetylase [Hyphomicrobium denitrificans 1NES1]
MRQASLHVLAVAALLSVAAIPPLYAEIEPGGAVKADTCADDGKTLGVSRTVEVDTNGGANIGGDRKNATHFLNDGEVVLTFDDGPAKASTRAILKALADQCTKATFFMVGQMALSDPAMVREVAAGGNTIGTHTWSHKNMRFANAKALDQQIESAISTVSKANGAPIAPLFRFPYLSSSRQADAYLESRNIGAVWVDVDSKDYLTRDPEVVKKRILAQLATTKKGIILMHDIHAWTATMLPGLLAELHDKGFKVVHMVAKAPVETIASYDAAAEKAIAAKTAAKAADPMAQRSLVWTMTPPPSAKHKVWKHVKKVQAKPSIVEGTPTTSPAPSADRNSGKTKDENQLWQFNLFN